jgi:hypothetical protein
MNVDGTITVGAFDIPASCDHPDRAPEAPLSNARGLTKACKVTMVEGALQCFEPRAATLVHAVQMDDPDARGTRPAGERGSAVDMGLAQRHEAGRRDILDDVDAGADVQQVVTPGRARRERPDIAIGAASRRGGDVEHGRSFVVGHGQQRVVERGGRRAAQVRCPEHTARYRQRKITSQTPWPSRTPLASNLVRGR